MKINRVELKNYRTHINGDFSFDRGINLLLGKNGAGKSSILEAAGLALFDADVRSTITDAVARGHKTATINVTFEGNDGNEYRVERKIGAGGSIKLYMQGEKSSRIDGREPVFQKIKELAGIEANEKNLFQNVITAYQNKIVDIFSDRPGEREKTFNQIFDTAIYRQMFEGFAKEARDNYSREIAIKSDGLERIGGQIKDSGELQKILKDKLAVKKQEDDKVINQKKEIDALEILRKKQEGLKNEIETVRADIKHKQELRDSKQKSKEKAVKDLAQSEQAVKIVAENQLIHVTYSDTEKRVRALGNAIEALEKKQAERDRFKENLSELITELKTNEESEKHQTFALVDKRKEKEKITAELSELQKECDNLKKDLSDLTEAGKQKGALEGNFKKFFEVLKKNKDDLKLLLNKIEELEKNKVDINKISDQQKIKQKEKEELLKKRIEKQNLEKKIGELQTRLSEIKNSEKFLSGGMCPFLQEQCLNIKSGTSPAEYITGRRNTLNEEIKNISQGLAAYLNIDDQISKTDTAIAKLESELERGRKDTSTLESFSNEKKVIDKEIEIASLQIKNILQPLEQECGQELAAKDFEAVALKLTDILTTLREQFKHQKAKADEAEKKLTKNKNDLKLLQKQIGETDAELKRLDTRKKELEKEQALLKEKIQSLDADLKSLDGLRETRKGLNAKLGELKPGYDLYVSNQQKAKELESHEKHIRELEKELEMISKDMRSLNEKFEKLLSEFSDEAYQKLIAEIKEKTSEKEALQSSIGELQAKIAIAQRELEENQKREQEHKEIKAQLSLLTRKLELAEKFRTNLGSMGKFVATRLMQTIETAATENFRRITGRSEEIRWVNNEKESYSVFLASGPDIEHQKRFEMLSGGEQVSLALSLRAAMASALTRANFAIFDEPTINLDAEKKVALAESLKEMLKNLNQAIIVTHDDTFREMAQKIICLD